MQHQLVTRLWYRWQNSHFMLWTNKRIELPVWSRGFMLVTNWWCWSTIWDVGDQFFRFKSHQLYDSEANISKLLPSLSHQHHHIKEVFPKKVANIKITWTFALISNGLSSTRFPTHHRWDNKIIWLKLFGFRKVQFIRSGNKLKLTQAVLKTVETTSPSMKIRKIHFQN